MQFDGAITNARSTLGHDLLKKGAVLFTPESDVRSIEEKLRASPSSYIGCELHPDGLEDFEDIFDIFAPIQAKQIAISTIHGVDPSSSGVLPCLDIGFRFEIPLASGNVTRRDVNDWIKSRQEALNAAVQLSWISRHEDAYLPIDFYDKKIMFPR